MSEVPLYHQNIRRRVLRYCWDAMRAVCKLCSVVSYPGGNLFSYWDISLI
jgi:hypothetical protein